jgi:dUTP pyrophosphatase
MTKTEEIMHSLYLETQRFKFDGAAVAEGPPGLKIKRLRPTTPESPVHATPDSAGLDLRADLTHNVTGSLVLYNGARLLIPTGLALEIPRGWVGLVCPRSGLAVKHGVTVLNAPGIIDADFRGEVKISLINHGVEPFEINHGDRIAQLVLMRVGQLPVKEVEGLSDTARGANGFGSSGVK